jgi:hypothetical protein
LGRSTTTDWGIFDRRSLARFVAIVAFAALRGLQQSYPDSEAFSIAAYPATATDG